MWVPSRAPRQSLIVGGGQADVGLVEAEKGEKGFVEASV
jgi:hypothetical protein